MLPFGQRAADQRHVDLGRRIEQPLFAGKFHHLHQVFGGGRVHLAAFQSWVDVGAQAHLGQQARRARGHVLGQVGEAALREVVGLDGAAHDHLHEGRAALPVVAAHHALDEARVGEVHHAAVAAVANRARGVEAQVARLAGREERGLDRLGDLFGKTHHRQAAQPDRGTVGDQAGHGLGVYQFVHGFLAFVIPANAGIHCLKGAVFRMRACTAMGGSRRSPG